MMYKRIIATIAIFAVIGLVFVFLLAKAHTSAGTENLYCYTNDEMDAFLRQMGHPGIPFIKLKRIPSGEKLWYTYWGSEKGSEYIAACVVDSAGGVEEVRVPAEVHPRPILRYDGKITAWEYANDWKRPDGFDSFQYDLVFPGEQELSLPRGVGYLVDDAGQYLCCHTFLHDKIEVSVRAVSDPTTERARLSLPPNLDFNALFVSPDVLVIPAVGWSSGRSFVVRYWFQREGDELRLTSEDKSAPLRGSLLGYPVSRPTLWIKDIDWKNERLLVEALYEVLIPDFIWKCQFYYDFKTKRWVKVGCRNGTALFLKEDVLRKAMAAGLHMLPEMGSPANNAAH